MLIALYYAKGENYETLSYQTNHAQIYFNEEN